MSVTVQIAREKPVLRPTINWDKLKPEGGWNPSIHQKPRKPIGKTK